MEAVRKRPQRVKAAKPTPKREEKDQETRFSDEEDQATLEAAIAELEAVATPDTTDQEIQQNEDDLLAFLQNADGSGEQELLVAEGEGSQPPNNHNGDGKSGENKAHEAAEGEQRQVTEGGGERNAAMDVPVIPVITGVSAPSAPVFEEDSTSEGGSEELPLLPKPSAPPPPPPARLTMPRAFHEIAVPAGIEMAAPSAPLGLEDDVVMAGHSRTTPSAPSLSPTTSKKLHRVVASPRNPEKLSPVVRIPVKAAAKTTVEDASVAVRNSFAKSHQAEKMAGLHSIYPSMPRDAANTAQTTTQATEGVADGAQASYEQLLKKKHIRVKLEPFVNYEMNLMRSEASQKRQEMKMRHIETNKGELYARIERYLFSEYILHTAASTMDEYKQKIDALVKKVWTLEKKRVSSSKRCGDNVEIEQQMEFQTAKLEALQLEKLKTHLDKLRQLRTVEASMHTSDRAIAYFHVEQYLNSVLQEPNLVAFLNKMSSSCGRVRGIDDLDLVPEGSNFYEALPQGSTLASSVDHLKYCLDVLIFFEKKVTLGEEGVFGRVPQSFYRGELIWHSTHAKMHYSAAGGAGMERKIKCYACGTLNAPMKTSQWCKLCESCDVVLYLPPSSVSTKTNEWFTSVLRFRQSLQKWISTCMQSLLRTKSLQNMPYLLMHVMYLPRISTDERSWFLRFLQFPRAMVRTDGSLRNEWSEDLVDHYIAMLHLVFHPEKLRRMSVIVSSRAPNSSSKSADVVGMTDSKGLVSPEWVLLENPEMLDRYFLSDGDFVAVLNQFPNTFAFEQLFRCTSDVKKSFSRALTLVLELTHSLRAFQEFEKLPTRIAQLIGQLLADAAALPGSGRPNEAGMKDAVFYPTLFDQLFLTSLHGLMAPDCNRVAWKSLNLFPFGSLSDLAKWDVLALLLFNLHSLPLEAKTASGWMQFIGKPSSQGVDTGALARQHLYDLIESDTESAMHLLNAVASLAASCRSGTSSEGNPFGERNDLVSVAVHELFMAGYTVGPCQHALGENGERAAGPLSTICLAHPWVLSLLITLLFKYHECAATWVHVFETFPINRWMPTPQDLLNLQEWLLLEDTAAPRSALARFLLDHINWEYDVKQQQLFTDAMLHRQVALMVAEALVLYKTRQERASDPESAIVLSGGGSPQKLEVTSIAKSIRRALWLAETIDFEKWCWKLMLKLRFYSPKTHEPLIPLIDLRHDRSREALTLRRWFAGASVLRVLPSRKMFPFYTSLEEQVSHLGDGDSNMRGPTDTGLSGNTGAPIQQENRMLLTPHSFTGDIESTVSATAAPRTEPIVAYVICQMTTFVFSDRLDRWEPLLVLLKSEFFPAAIKVLDNLFPILSRLDKTKDFSAKPAPASAPQTESENESKSTSNSEDDGEAILSSDEVEAEGEIPAQASGVMMEVDNELEICMAAMHALSTDELLSLLKSLHEFSYINTDELHRMQEVLNKGYIGGWESTAKVRILAKLRFVRECSRYLHPVVLPALINECFPQSSPMSVTTSALFHGAMSWISSALGGENSSGALSPSASSSTSAALSIRNSSLTATTASLAMIAGNEYSPSTKSLCALIQRSFEYSVDNVSLTESMRFWMKALLQVPFWNENAGFRHVLDTVLHCSMESSYELNFVKGGVRANSQSLSSDILYEMVGLLESAFDSFCQRTAQREENTGQPEQQFLENEPVIVMSFLPAVAASATFASIFGGSFDVAQYVRGCPYLALWSLLIETRKEVPLFLTMGQLMIKYEPKAMKKLEKMKKTEGRLAEALAAMRDGKSLDDQAEEVIYEAPSSMSHVGNPFAFSHTSLDSLGQYKIYRWCNYCLDLPESESTQIIYWQVFFALYFATTGGSHVFGHHFLDRSGNRSTKRVHLRKHLQTKLRKLVNYCSNQAQVVLTAASGSGPSGVNSVVELKERKYAHFVALSQLYTAMDAWLEEQDPNQWLKEEELTGLPRHYEVERLKDVLRLSDALLNPHPDDLNWFDLPLWTNWCGFEFTVRRTTPRAISRSETSNESLVPSLSTPLATVGEDDDFAFVEEASELARRHSSFGGLAGLTALSIRPLPLVADLCGPACLTQLPTVSVIVSVERCAITPSIPLNKAGLKGFAMKFSENLSVLVALDSEMVDNVSRLYVSKARTVTQSLTCSEGTSCRSPAAFRFEFLEWMMASRMDDAIQSIRAQGERCDMRSMVVKSVMSSLSEHTQESSGAVSSATPPAAEQFLQLDGNGFMLALQILLIDQVVRTLDVEHQKLQRQKKTLEDEAPLETIKDEDGEESIAEADDPPESENLTPMEENEKQTELLHNKGLEWFRLLTELDTKLSRMVPPLREALWRSIKQLGLSFVCVDERETCTLLQLMLEDPSRIILLSECFFPAAAPSRFVEMFAKLMSASSSSKLSSEEKLTLLRRFDFRAWLQTKSPQTPTKFDRDTVLCMILGDISHQFPADRSLVNTGRKATNSNESQTLVLRVYAKILQLVCSANLEDHVEKMVHALVGVHDDYRFQTSTVSSGELTSSGSENDDSSSSGLAALPRPVDAVVWEALVGIPLAAWKELPIMQIESCVAFLSQHMTSLRWQSGLSATTGSGHSTGGEIVRGRQTSSASTTKYPIVYWQRLGVLKSFLDLFTLCCRVAPEKQQWELITAFFEPLLSTLYQPATNTEGSAIGAPWSEQDTVSTGTTICSCFVATCSEYLKSQPSAGSQQRTVMASNSHDKELTQTTKLSQIWSFYLAVLVPHAPTHICKHFHQFVTRLAWEHWCLTLEIVQQMRELVQTEKQQLTGVAANTDQRVPPLHSTLSPYPFVSWLVRDVLCRTMWKSTDAWLEAQSEAVCSSFLLEFAKLCLELVLDMPHFQVQSNHAASTNVLPPYFVNFIKQQSVFWVKWKMTLGDLETLKQFTLEALKEPLGGRAGPRTGASMVSAGLFPATPSAATMQDAFTRLQLVLRLLGQITTLHHAKLPKQESLQRVGLFLKLLFGVFEVNDRGSLDGNRYNSAYAAWLMVLYGSSCTALYEKLDEIVHFYKQDAGKDNAESVGESKEGVSEEDLTAAMSEVLRFCNLSLVEVFFKKMQSSPKAGGNGGSGGSSSSSGSNSLNWNKCGNVVFVEVDALVRDFTSSQKALQQKSYRSQQNSSDRSSDKEEDSSGTVISANRSPAEVIGTPLGKVLWSFVAFRGGELACLAACGRALASVHVMSQVAEKSIEKWVIEERRGMWDALALRLQVPELSSEEFEAACLEQGKLLTLQVLFLQQLRRAPVLTESLSLALLTKLMSWMQRARVGSSSLAQMKLLFLAAEVTNFVCKPLADVLPSTLKKQMLRQLCDLLLELGHARRNNGIMKAIGLGGSLQYGVEFHVSCLSAGIFLRLQTRNGAPLRVDDRIPFKMTRTTEKHLRSLETMLQSKDAFQLGRRADALMNFARDARRSLADQDELFVTLFSSMYPAQGWLLAKCLP